MKTITVTQDMEVNVTFIVEVDDDFDDTDLDNIPCQVIVDPSFPEDDELKITGISVDNVYTFNCEVVSD